MPGIPSRAETPKLIVFIGQDIPVYIEKIFVIKSPIGPKIKYFIDEAIGCFVFKIKFTTTSIINIEIKPIIFKIECSILRHFLNLRNFIKLNFVH